MKILHFAPFLQAGGASRLAADLPYALQMFDVQSLVLCPEGEHISPLTSSLLKHRDFRPYPLPGQLGSVLRLRSFIRSYQPHVVQAYGFEALSIAVRAWDMLAESERPRLVAALTGYPDRRDRMSGPELEACHAVTAVSLHLHRELMGLRPDLRNCHAIPYGVNETLCHPGYAPTPAQCERWRLERPELLGRYVICVPGPISAMHGTTAIVPLISTLLHQDIPAHVLLTGDASAAEPSYLSSLRRQLRAAAIESRVTWLGPRPDLRDILCLSDATLCLTSAPEAYDRPILEALALGRPVAGYAHGAVLDYLEEMNPVGALPPGNVDAAADVLSQWHASPPDALPAVPAPYRLSDTAQSYYNLYTSLLGS